MGFSRQEHWSRLPWPPPGDLPNPGIKPGSLVLQEVSLPSEPPGQAFVVVQLLSRVRLFVTSWNVAWQASLSMVFPRQGHWSGLPFASPRDIPDSGTEPVSPALQVDSLLLCHLGSPQVSIYYAVSVLFLWDLVILKQRASFSETCVGWTLFF